MTSSSPSLGNRQEGQANRGGGLGPGVGGIPRMMDPSNSVGVGSDGGRVRKVTGKGLFQEQGSVRWVELTSA